jgi:hypothetical protein
VPIQTVDLTEAERSTSERFWAYVIDYDNYGEVFDTIEEMVSEVDLVIRGRLVGVHDGLRYPYNRDSGAGETEPWTTAIGVVELLEVVSGEPTSRDAGFIEVQGLGWPGMGTDDLPTEEFLLFLNNDSTWRAELGVDPEPDENTKYYYVLPNPFQTAFNNIDGVISLVPGPDGWEEAFGPFPSELDGTAYIDVVEAARSAAD